MKQKRDLIIIGTDWLSCPVSSRELFLRLAKNRKVLWVATLAGSETAPSPIYHLNIRLPFGSDISWLQGLRQFWLAKQIRDTRHYLNMHEPVLVFLNPDAHRLADNLGIHSIVYYRDEYSLPMQDDNSAQWLEKQLIAKAGLLIASTRQQAANLPAYKTVLLHHENKASWQSRPRDLPKGRPIIGFHGPLSEQLDWELLESAAKRRPDWYWVLIGPRQSPQLDHLLQQRNVFWLGEKSVEQLPAYLQHWQVTLLPYHNTAEICQCPPLQLEWALHSDTPLVVTADFKGLPSFKPLLSRIHNMHELCELLPIVGGPPQPSLTTQTTLLPQRGFDLERKASTTADTSAKHWDAEELGLLLDSMQ